jgi:REP element-mobilizing transposase RayT
MIEQLKAIQYELRTTEKYLFSIIKNEWMTDHPHFMRNDKQELKDIVKNLKKRQRILNTKIKELEKDK